MGSRAYAVVIRPSLTMALAAGFLFASPFMARSSTASAHPLHTSLAEVSFDESRRAVDVSLRVFVNDFTEASRTHAAKSPERSANRSPLIAYALANFRLSDADGHEVPLSSCGGKRVGDLMWLCFRGRFVLPPAGARIVSSVLFDKYRDQINVVQASYGGRKENLLFTYGDGAKRLP